MKAYERFLKYVSVWTTSDETSETVPSADRELVLAELLVEEMKELGIEDARVDEKGYVYGSVPATLGCENAPALGLIAHMDTAPDAPGDNIHPQIIDFFLNLFFCQLCHMVSLQVFFFLFILFFVLLHGYHLPVISINILSF